MPFADTDEMIVRRLQMPITRLFEQYGEAYFRDRESEAVEEASRLSGCVIATGGGIIKRESNMTKLRETGVVFYLCCGADRLRERMAQDTGRPLLHIPADGGSSVSVGPSEDDRLTRIRALLAEREPLYRQYSDYVIHTDEDEPEPLARRIAALFQGRSGG